MPHFMIVLIPYINLLNLFWIIKCIFSRNMEPLKEVIPNLKESQILKGPNNFPPGALSYLTVAENRAMYR